MVDSMEHLRNVELDCAADADALHEERLALLANHEGRSGYEVRSSMHSLQRSAAIDDYDEATCDETLETLSATLQVPTLRLNSMALVPPYERDGWDEGLMRLPEEFRNAWITNAASLASQETRSTQFAEWSLFLIG